MSSPHGVITDDSGKCRTLNPVALRSGSPFCLLLLRSFYVFMWRILQITGETKSTSTIVPRGYFCNECFGRFGQVVFLDTYYVPTAGVHCLLPDCSVWLGPGMPFPDFAVRSQILPLVSWHFPPGSPWLVQCPKFPYHTGWTPICPGSLLTYSPATSRSSLSGPAL